MKHYFHLSIVFCFILACGKKADSPTENNTHKDSLVQETTIQEKDYLNKRPEEFQEFVMLSGELPFLDKVALKEDVVEKRALFHLDSKGDPSHKPLSIKLPFFAFLQSPENNPSQFVVILQAEFLKGDTILGYKSGSGAVGICKPGELEIFNSQKATVFQTVKN